MNRLIQIIIAYLCLSAPSAQAVVINAINVSTVAGYSESYYPGDFNRFGILGVPLTYSLSDGRTASFGAGWIPYTNGTVTNEQVTANGHIRYEFGSLNNWARGQGVLFYHIGLVDLPWPGGYWTEGELIPASPVVLDAVIGSDTAVLSGLARISLNNASSYWSGGYFDYISYAVPEGAIVPYTAIYTLLNGDTWTPGIFNSPFNYQLNGTISFVPEPSSLALAVLALVGIAIRITSIRKLSSVRPRKA